jgi:hypothetical protein
VSTAGTHCPRCGRPEVLDLAAGPAPERCPGCGLELTPDLLRELAYLDSVEAWASSRRTALLSGAVAPVTVTAQSAQSAQAAHPAPVRPRVTAAGALLATGAFALVVAGLAFTAVAWELLGALGQLLVLVAVGALALVAGRLLASRIPGTATALAVTGAALLAVAAGFLLSSADAGDPWVRSGAIVVLGLGGLVLAGRQARVQPAAGAFSAVVAGVLVVVALALVPVLAPQTVSRADLLWLSAVLVLGGAGLALLARAPAWLVPPRAPWAVIGSGTTAVGTCLAAGVTADYAAERAWASEGVLWPPAVAAVVIGLGALLLLVVDRLLGGRRWAPAVAAIALEALAGLLVLAVFLAGERPGALVLVAVVWGSVVGATVAHLRHTRRDDTGAPRPGWDLLAGILLRAVPVASGAGVAGAVAAWRPGSPPAAWPQVVAGLVVGLLGVVLATGWVLAVRRGLRGADLPLVAAAATGLVWTGQVAMTGSTGLADPRGAVATAWLVLGLGVLAVLVAVRWAATTYWFAGAAATLGAGLLVPVDRAPSAVTPWLVGLVLATPLVLTAIAVARRTASRASLLAAPALAALLAPPVLAVVGDSLSGAYGDGVTDGIEVAVLVSAALVATLVTVAGARQHLAGPLWVGLVAVLVVVLAQLVTWASVFPQWLTLTVVGAVLVLVGARWEWVRARGRRTRAWAAQLH